MVDIEWCCKQKAGIKLGEPTDNVASGYVNLAENSLGTMNREKEHNIVFSVSACYYAMYYSLYAILSKIGIKCEIHSCSIELMDFFDYDSEDKNLLEKSFGIRNTLQYYVDKIIDEKEIDFIIDKSSAFVAKSREILENLNEEDIDAIRNKIKEIIKKSRQSKVMTRGKDDDVNVKKGVVGDEE